jgi:hypothetical protein
MQSSHNFPRAVLQTPQVQSYHKISKNAIKSQRFLVCSSIHIDSKLPQNFKECNQSTIQVKDVDVGLNFAMHTPLKKSEISVFMEIKSKTGRDISDISEKNGIFASENQHEVLFTTNIKFEIIDKKIDSDGTVWLKMVEI